MLGGATQAMSLYIVEERQQRRRPLAAAPLGLRPPGRLAQVMFTLAIGVPRKVCSPLLSSLRAGDRQQNVKVFLREP